MIEPERLPKKKAIEELKDWIPDIAKHDLSLKQMRFLVAYIGNNFNATDAYHACNSIKRDEDDEDDDDFNRNTAAKKGCGMLKHPKIQAAIGDYMRAFIGDNKEKLEYRLLNQLVLFAFYDPFDVITVTGELRPIEEIPYDHRQLISGIETQRHPKDPEITTTKVKLADRKPARQELEKYMGVLNNKVIESMKLEDGIKERLKDFLTDMRSDLKPPVIKNAIKPIKKAED